MVPIWYHWFNRFALPHYGIGQSVTASWTPTYSRKGFNQAVVLRFGNAPLNGCVVRRFKLVGHSGPNRIQVNIGYALQQCSFIQQSLGFETSLPKIFPYNRLPHWPDVRWAHSGSA